MSLTKLLFGAVVTAALAGLMATAQNHRRNIWSAPKLPPEEVLKRLNLHLGWRVNVPMDGQKDAFLRIVLDDKDLISLTKSGLVTVLDAETGQTRWRARVGAKPYTILPYVGMNKRSVYVIANAILVALDRENGAVRWDYPIPGSITAGPAVDKTRVFLPTSSTTLFAFNLPFLGDSGLAGGGIREGVALGEERNTPRAIWAAKTDVSLSFRPLMSRRVVAVVSPEGQMLGFHKTPRIPGEAAEAFAPIDLGHKIAVQPTAFGDTAYLGCDDASLYAINLNTGRLRWRHTAGTAISRAPVILDSDVYFTSEREGLARLDRETGEPKWKIPSGRTFAEGNANADRFLAANTRYVYANDHSGRLLVLDRKRGTRLSMFDTSAFRFPVVNDITDRLYLSANDGLIACLHDRDQREPLQLRRTLQEATLARILEAPISEPSARDQVPLQEALANLEDRHDVDFVFDRRAFAEAMIAVPDTRPVRLITWENRPLRDYLTQMFGQVGASFEVVQDTIRIIPQPAKGGKGKEPEKDKEPAKDKEPEKDK